MAGLVNVHSPDAVAGALSNVAPYVPPRADSAWLLNLDVRNRLRSIVELQDPTDLQATARLALAAGASQTALLLGQDWHDKPDVFVRETAYTQRIMGADLLDAVTVRTSGALLTSAARAGTLERQVPLGIPPGPPDRPVDLLLAVGPEDELCPPCRFETHRHRALPVPAGVRVDTPQVAADLVGPSLTGLDREHAVTLALSPGGHLLGSTVTSIGSSSQTFQGAREVYGDALSLGAAHVIVVHNHPSGQLSPSEPDHKVFANLSFAARTLGVPLIDSIVVGDGNRWESLAANLLDNPQLASERAASYGHSVPVGPSRPPRPAVASTPAVARAWSR